MSESYFNPHLVQPTILPTKPCCHATVPPPPPNFSNTLGCALLIGNGGSATAWIPESNLDKKKNETKTNKHGSLCPESRFQRSDSGIHAVAIIIALPKQQSTSWKGVHGLVSPASLLDSQHGCITSPHAKKESGQTP